jgi:hypothetical protein
MRAALAKGLLLVVLLGAVGSTSAACAAGCPTALLSGTLVANGSELWIKEDGNGFPRPIRWPSGFGVRSVDGRLVVADAFGGIKAAEGDLVQLPGGEIGSNGPWGVCGDMDSIRRFLTPVSGIGRAAARRRTDPRNPGPRGRVTRP